MKESRQVHAVGTLRAESGKPAGKRKNGLPFYTHLPGNLFRFEEMPRPFQWENPPVEGKGIQEENANFLRLQSLMIFLLPLMVLKESAKGFVVEMLISAFSSVQFSSVAQSCPTLCDPMNCSTPGLPVHHQLLEFTQTHVHQVSDAIQPFHPLSSPSPPASNPSQHQSLF